MTFTTHTKTNDDQVDIVIVLGEENENAKFYQKIKAYCDQSNLKYVILGDGSKPINLEDIQNLPQAKHVAIAGHGLIKKHGKHEISLGNKDSNTLDVIKAIQHQTGSKNIVLSSCYGGKVVDEVRESSNRELLEGTNLFVTSSKDEPTMVSDSLNVIDNYVKKIATYKNPPVIDVVKDAINQAPLTMVFLHQTENNDDEPSQVKTHTIRRQDRFLYHDAKKFCEYQNNLFNDFVDEVVREGRSTALVNELRDFYPNFANYETQLGGPKKSNLLTFNMSAKEVEKFQEIAILNHAILSDTKILDSILSKLSSTAHVPEQLLFKTMIKGDDLAPVVEVLLKHVDKKLKNQNVNSLDTKDKNMLETPLTMALVNQMPETTKVLIKAGADIYKSDGFKRTPHKMMATSSEYHHIFPELIKESNAVFSLDTLQPPKNLLEAHQKFKSVCQKEGDQDFFSGISPLPKNEKVFKAFQEYLKLATHPDIKQEMNFASRVLNDLNTHFSPLLADNKINPLAVGQLLKNGKNTTCTEIDKDVALYLAAKYGLDATVRTLLKNGASTMVQDVDGQNVLDIVKTNSHESIYNEIVSFEGRSKRNSSSQDLSGLVGKVGFYKDSNKILNGSTEGKINALKTKIINHIEKVKKEGGYVEDGDTWTKKDSRYKDKHRVLTEFLKYLDSDRSPEALNDLKTIVDTSKDWRKGGIVQSTTEKLYNEVISIKTELKARAASTENITIKKNF